MSGKQSPLWKHLFKDNPQRTYYAISDLHFGHKNVITFAPPGGQPWRNFATIEEHDETLVRNWNTVVKKNDVVVVLGDVVFNGDLSVLKRLNGEKLLIMGNHDTAPIVEYLEHFADVRAMVYGHSKRVGRIVFSHAPLHMDNFEYHNRWNIHGHLHSTVIDDPRYFNVSVECNGGFPVPLKTIEETFAYHDRLRHNDE